ncbi:hypothetical protein ACFP3I_03440 [Chryseobacterium arachidis]
MPRQSGLGFHSFISTLENIHKACQPVKDLSMVLEINTFGKVRAKIPTK